MTRLEVGQRVVATAPVRVADVGGWTDTWFGSPGRACHLAVGPGVEVEVRASRTSEPEVHQAGSGPVVVHLPTMGIEPYRIGPGSSGWSSATTGGHPLVEHAIGAVLERVPAVEGDGIVVTVRSDVPPGASLGTSAAVVVATIAAVDAACTEERMLPEDVARLAHRVETERVGREAGVQDQWAAALGGCGLLAIGPYPDVRHEPIPIDARTEAELGRRLLTVVFGPHDSSLVHAEVINAVVGCSGVEHDRARRALTRLSVLAGDAAAALADGSVDGWGEVLTEATETQRTLHPGLVGGAHEAAIQVARSLGARGWKVNGAGGDGGSLTILSGADGAAPLRAALADTGPAWRILDLEPAAAGLRISERPAPA